MRGNENNNKQIRGTLITLTNFFHSSEYFFDKQILQNKITLKVFEYFCRSLVVEKVNCKMTIFVFDVGPVEIFFYHRFVHF